MYRTEDNGLTETWVLKNYGIDDRAAASPLAAEPFRSSVSPLWDSGYLRYFDTVELM